MQLNDEECAMVQALLEKHVEQLAGAVAAHRKFAALADKWRKGNANEKPNASSDAGAPAGDGK